MTDVLAPLALFLGGLVCAVNFYLSFCRYPVHRLRGGSRESYRPISGAPVVGSLLVALSIFGIDDTPWILGAALLLIAMDTGGLHWFAGTLIVQSWLKRTS